MKVQDTRASQAHCFVLNINAEHRVLTVLQDEGRLQPQLGNEGEYMRQSSRQWNVNERAERIYHRGQVLTVSLDLLFFLGWAAIYMYIYELPRGWGAGVINSDLFKSSLVCCKAVVSLLFFSQTNLLPDVLRSHLINKKKGNIYMNSIITCFRAS